MKNLELYSKKEQCLLLINIIEQPIWLSINNTKCFDFLFKNLNAENLDSLLKLPQKIINNLCYNVLDRFSKICYFQYVIGINMNLGSYNVVGAWRWSKIKKRKVSVFYKYY